MIEKNVENLKLILLLTYLIIMGFKTTLSRASTITNSLRTTVPSGIISHFDLEEGDKLNWTLKPGKGELIILIKPEKMKK